MMIQEQTPVRRNAAYGLTLAGLIGMAIFGWSHVGPAAAQNDPNNPNGGPQQGRPGFGGGGFGGPGGGFGGPMMGGGAITSNGSYVYVLRGNTVFQMRADTLAVVTHKDLPAQQGGMGGPGGGGFGGGFGGPGQGGFGGGGGQQGGGLGGRSGGRPGGPPGGDGNP